MLKSSSLCLNSSNLDTFWLKIKQFWPFEEISIIFLLETTRPISTKVCLGDLRWSPFKIVSVSSVLYPRWPLLQWRAWLSDIILKGTDPGTIPARFGLLVIWFSGFRREDLNVIFYQNMPNLHIYFWIFL
jgi:hypothetical protein